MRSFIGNKSTEKDIRDWLSQNGFLGKSADFAEIELHAIKRPGWLQVFRFDVRVKDAQREWQHLFGAVRCDERYGNPKMCVSRDLDERDSQLAEWSENLITQARRKT